MEIVLKQNILLYPPSACECSKSAHLFIYLFKKKSANKTLLFSFNKFLKLNVVEVTEPFPYRYHLSMSHKAVCVWETDHWRLKTKEVVQPIIKRKVKTAENIQTDLPHFFVLLFLLFLLLFFRPESFLFVNKRLVSLWEECKVNFSVGLIALSIIAPRVMQTLPVVHTVHMSVIIYPLHYSEPVGRRRDRLALHVVMIVAAPRHVKK